jgi:hypothetical protein
MEEMKARFSSGSDCRKRRILTSSSSDSAESSGEHESLVGSGPTQSTQEGPVSDPPRSGSRVGSEGSPSRLEPKVLIPTTVDLSEVSLTAAEADKLRVKDWNDIVDAVRVMCKEQMPSPKETTDKPALHRVPSPGDALRAPDPAHLPLDPVYSSVFGAFQAQIQKPASRGAAKRDPMGVGEYFEPDRPAQEKYFRPEDRPHFLSPMELPSEVNMLDSSQSKPRVGEFKLTERMLIAQERQQRELLAIASARSWLRETLSLILRECAAAEHSAAYVASMEAILRQDRELQAMELDRLSTDFVNTILRRRDLYLKAIKPPLSQEDLVALRQSDFLDSSLFSRLDRSFLEQRKDTAHTAVVMAAAQKVGSQPKAPPRAQTSQPGPSGAGEGAKARSRKKRSSKRSFSKRKEKAAAAKAKAGKGSGSAKPTPTKGPQGGSQ